MGSGEAREFNPVDLLEIPPKWRGRPRLSIEPQLRTKRDYNEAAQREMRTLWAQNTWRKKLLRTQEATVLLDPA